MLDYPLHLFLGRLPFNICWRRSSTGSTLKRNLVIFDKHCCFWVSTTRANDESVNKIVYCLLYLLSVDFPFQLEIIQILWVDSTRQSERALHPLLNTAAASLDAAADVGDIRYDGHVRGLPKRDSGHHVPVRFGVFTLLDGYHLSRGLH